MKTAHDLVQEAKAQIQEVSLDNAEAAISDAALLLDVREGDEYHAGHIPGAVSIPRGLLEFKLSNDPALDIRDQPIVIYCKTSGRAALAAASMKSMGYLHVQSIEGGFDAWQDAGKPVVTPDMPDFE
ncbi:sulfurtransferase [Alcanivorax sp. S6407]|uniref:rhodanese-like domain-containing protein n=1 Tax=Alcanivorax sp. S6407 TaxID=2926424 RepID=UPI001FF4C835|nr:rhodanese-like domain-containing protein [Alcanivorax sp. S6407]MCK0154350.1 sulfurtransferase [Alcanivorax sp. S6407]